MARLALAVFRLVSLLSLVHAQITILSPKELINNVGHEGSIVGSTAMFGTPYYDTKLMGKLVYGPSSQADKDKPHCKNESYTVPRVASEEVGAFEGKADGTFTRAKYLQIVVVERGGCSFVTKVQIAQDFKEANAVIIVDRANSGLTAEDIKNIIVADDGWGGSVRIPSILISHMEGQKLIDSIQHKPEVDVLVQLSWDVPKGQIVKVEKWFSSSDRDSMAFFEEFAPKRRELKWVVQFTPHFSLGPSMFRDAAHDMCFDAEGKYCHPDPDSSGDISGKDVLTEDLRMLCIHKHSKIDMADSDFDEDAISHDVTSAKYAEKFWEYLERFGVRCPIQPAHPDSPRAEYFGEECSNNLMREVGLDVKQIDDCIRNDGIKFLEQQRVNTAWDFRAIRINGWRYTGTLEVQPVVRAICSGFARRPKVCDDALRSDSYPGFPGQTETPQQPASFNMSTFVIALMIVIVLTISALLLYQRSLRTHIHSALREEVMLEVQSQMESYKQLPS